MNKKWHLLSSIIVCILVIMVDQLSKWWALSILPAGEYKITPWFSFHLVFNRGISWGMLSSENILTFWLLTTLIMVITGFLITVVYQRLLTNRGIIGHALLIAGSISNIIDRFIHHAVVDFIALAFKGWMFPVFNVADCSIVLGVIVIVMTQFRDI